MKALLVVFDEAGNLQSVKQLFDGVFQVCDQDLWLESDVDFWFEGGSFTAVSFTVETSVSAPDELQLEEVVKVITAYEGEFKKGQLYAFVFDLSPEPAVEPDEYEVPADESEDE